MGATVPHLAEGTFAVELLGYVRAQQRGRERALMAKLGRMTSALEVLAMFNVAPEFMLLTEEQEASAMDDWSALLDQIVGMRRVLASPEANAFVSDVGRYLSGQRERLESRIRAADANLAEGERFIRDFVLGEGPGELIPRVEAGAPGPSFEF